MLLIMLAVATLSPAAIPRAEPVKPVQIKPLPLAQRKITLAPVVFVPRPGKSDAAQVRAGITLRNTVIRQKTVPLATTMAPMTMPGITRVNGTTNGVFEPGADYQITGRGFGKKSSYAFVRAGGKMIPLAIVHWSDEFILARLADDVSGLPDIAGVELDVGPEGKPVFKWSRYGFRAARADVALPITDAMVRSDPRQIKLPGMPAVTVPTAPDKMSFDGEFMHVTRHVSDTGDQKKCIEPGTDRIHWNVPLRAGFEVTGYNFRPASLKANQTETPRGKYSAGWQGDDLRISYGVMRFYDPPGLFRSATGACYSTYAIKLVVTGPRGLAPTP